MGKTTMKADTKNAWFYVAGILAALQGVQFTGKFLETLPGGNTKKIVIAAAEALIFILFALSIFFIASRNLKKTAIPSALVCLYMSASTYGLISLLQQALDGADSISAAASSLTTILKIAASAGYVILMIIYILKCLGKFQTRRPLLIAALAVLLISQALSVMGRLDHNSTIINALFTIDLSQTFLSVPIIFTALALSLKH